MSSNNMFELTGKFALVTGGADGIGLSIVEELLKKGLRGVSVIDIDEGRGQEVVQQLKETYGTNRVIFIKADVSSKKEMEDAFEGTVSTFKNLDIVVNNVGIVNEIDWDKQVDVNVNATVRSTYLALDNYLPNYQQSGGIIVNISSITGVYPSECMPVYSASKMALLGLGMALGGKLTYNRTKVKVLTVCPGITSTGMTLDHRNMILSKEMMQAATEEFNYDKTALQPSECVGKAVVKVIQEGENGGIFIAEESKSVYQISFPKRNDMVTHIL